MDPTSRIGPADADVIVFNKGGRDFRMERLERGQEVPREFFYGYLELEKAGIRAAMMSGAGRMPGPLGLFADAAERAFARVAALGARPVSTRLLTSCLGTPKVLISYTDGFSLSLGLALPRRPGRPILMGGFHGLSDIEERAPVSLRALVRTLISRAVAALDHAFFFGPADRAICIERYGISADRSSIFPFGIDTEFWCPLPGEPRADFAVAIGQDRNRDYDLLAAAPGRNPMRIVTRQPVIIPPGADHVSTTVGDFFGSDSMSDEDLRRLYNIAAAIVVPLKDVYQPTGYSVALQAMSCGRPLILSRIKGLWAPELYQDGENCLLVPPGNAQALGEAITRVRSDPEFGQRLGRAGRETALRHFALGRMTQGTLALAREGLSLHARMRAA